MADQSPVAVVTGASRGIGKQCALALAEKGFDVVACARTVRPGTVQEVSDTAAVSVKKAIPGSLEETVLEAQALGRRALGVPVDLLRKEDIDALVKAVMDEFGRIDVVVNNARWVGQGFYDPFLQTPFSVFEESMQVNALAPLYLLHKAVPIMAKQGGGVIVHISSGAGLKETPAVPAGTWKSGWGLSYAVTKAAFNRIAPGLAKELKQHNIAIMNLEPGSVHVERKSVQRGKEYNPETGVPAEAIGRACAYIATARHPMFYSGLTIEGPEFAVEHGLIEPERMPPPHDMAHWGRPDRPRGNSRPGGIAF